MKKTLKNRGFTIFELLVVIAIIVIISAVTIPNYRSIQQRNSLTRAVQRVILDLRTVQSMSLGAKEITGLPQVVPLGGYGIVFRTDDTFYTIYADSGDKVYNEGLDKDLQKIPLENGVKFCSLSKSPILSINFTPPDPIITFPDDDTTGTITLCLENDETNQRKITINKVGMISVGK